MLYLHETIDIVGDGQDAYLDAVARRARHSEAEGISRLVACWRVVGSTGRWPRVVNLWEMDGWSHWAAALERQFVPERRDPALAPWWAQTAQWRSGGFDRILEPAPGSPTRAELQAGGLRAWVCEQTTVIAAPGRVEDLLATATTLLTPALRRRGIRRFGAFRVPMHPDELLLFWAAPTFAALAGWYEEREGEPAWRRWAAERDAAAQQAESLWLVPAPDCFFHPAQGPAPAGRKGARRTRAGN